MSESDARPIRVLQVLSQDAIGGTENMVASLAERMDSRRITSEVAVFSSPGPISARLQAKGIPVHSLRGGGLLGAASGIARLVRARRFDVLNAYGFRAGLVGRLSVGLGPHRPKVIQGVRGLLVTETEDLDSSKARVALGIERLTRRRVDLYDCNSPGAVELLVAHGIPGDRIRCIPNGIDLAHWRADAEPDVSTRAPQIVTVARFSPLKRHQDLLRALSSLANEGLEFRAVLAGSGPTLSRCRDLARELGVEAQVEFPGEIPHVAVPGLLRRSQIACLPSAWEGMPGFVMEAMAAGIPVVATDVNGSNLLVVEEATGLLVPPQDPEALANALRRLLSDSALRRQLGAAGRQRVEREFSLAAMVSAKQDLYEEVCGA